jgi:TolB-like protein/Tfp pilus assembly protein PilF
MASESPLELKFEIGHVLFIDIVGYSKLLITEQTEQIQKLKGIVRGTEQVRLAEAEGKLLRLPTGDGAALVFRTSPEVPVLCALEIANELKNHPELRVRMGIHSGPVNEVVDLNEQSNIAGAGINIAQRVLDCGDTGHILLSKRVADDLEQYPKWRSYLHDIGTFEVKHGLRVSVTNLYSDEVGNPNLPSKLQAVKKHHAHVRWAEVAIALLVLVAIIGGVVFLLRKPMHPAVAMVEKSIAVLPFENLSSDKENAYFADAIQDEILTRLAQLRELKVISRTSTEKYPSRPQNLKTIRAELGVATILEGSVQKLASEAHINVQLIDALTEAHIWAQSYDRTLEHVFAVEGEVAQSVADALKLKLVPAQIEKLTAVPTKNPKAYDLFLRGEYVRDRAWKSGGYEQTLKPAIASYREAIALDPQFALALAQLADTQLTEYHFGLIDSSATRMPELLVSAKENIDRALSLESELPAAHSALGYWHYWGNADYSAALVEFKRALTIDPQFSDAVLGITGIALRQGRPDEAIERVSKMLELDPRNVQLLRTLGGAYRMRKDYAKAVELSSRAVALDPTDALDALNLSQDIIMESGDIGAASKPLDALPTELQKNAIIAEQRVTLLMLGRDFAGARKIVENVPPESWRSSWSRPQWLGEIQSALGQKELAQESLQQARALLTSAIAKDSEEPVTHATLAQVDAELGLADEALREANRAIDLQPFEKDAFWGREWLVNLAEVNARLGRTDEAIKLLERMLAMPIDTISVWELKLDPSWDPLRGDPRFQKIVASLAPKDAKP